MEAKKGNARVVETWEDWTGENTAWIEFPRKNGTIDRFLCRGLSGEDVDYINKQCTPPDPPRKPKYGSDNKPIIISGRAQTELDYENEEYKAQALALADKKAVLVLERGLVKPDGKKIPGTTWQEKFTNLNKKLRGDVLKLVNFINLELSNLQQDDVNFF